MNNKRIKNNFNEAINCLSLVERELEDNKLTNELRRIIDEIEELQQESVSTAK